MVLGIPWGESGQQTAAHRGLLPQQVEEAGRDVGRWQMLQETHELAHPSLILTCSSLTESFTFISLLMLAKSLHLKWVLFFPL